MASIQANHRRYQTAIKMINLYNRFLAAKDGTDKKIIRRLLIKWERQAASLEIRLGSLKKRKTAKRAVN